MSAEEQKPTETPVVAETTPAEPAPVIAEEVKPEEKKEEAPVEADKPAETTEAAADKPAEAEEAKEEAKEEKKEEKKEPEPITSGVLGYKAPGLVKSIIFSKKYFFLGEEPISTQNLSRYLRGEKPEVAHSAAAWSSQTGKGLLYFAKRVEDKANPIGVLKLADASDLSKSAIDEITVKFGTHKHSFQAPTSKDRDGWYLALEKAVEEAKAAAEEIVNSEGYKETMSKLGKPTALATPSKPDATPKKSTEVKPAEGATEERAGSSSSEDADKKKAPEKKSRSVSRGKRASLFGTLLGKKEEAKEKVEEKKEEKKEEEEAKKEGEEAKEPVAEEPAAEASTAAPAAETTEVKPAEEKKEEEETKEEAKEEAAKEEPKAETPKPKASKRASIFGSFFEKVKSPTSEKKEAEVAPVPPPKDEPEAEASAAADKPAEDKPAEDKPVEEVAKEEPKEEAKEEPKEETKEEEAKPAATPDTKEKRRTSFFGNFGTKKEKKATADSEGETTEGEKEKKPKLGGLFRNPSKAVKGNKEKKEATTPAKVEEETPATEEAVEEPKKEEAPAAEEPKKEEPKEEPKPAIGDVVPEAVTVGSTPAVQATA